MKHVVCVNYTLEGAEQVEVIPCDDAENASAEFARQVERHRSELEDTALNDGGTVTSSVKGRFIEDVAKLKKETTVAQAILTLKGTNFDTTTVIEWRCLP